MSYMRPNGYARDPRNIRRQIPVMVKRRPTSGYLGDLGIVMPIIQGVQAAKQIIAMNPSAQKIKDKLDKLSVGAHVMKGVKKLLGGSKSTGDQYRDAYYKVAGSVAGSDYSALDFNHAFFGMWQSNRGNYPGHAKYPSSNGETFKAALAQKILDAILAGKLTNEDTAGTIFTKVISPWLQEMQPNWGQAGRNRDLLTQITVDLIDRYIHNLPIMRADIPEYKGQGYTLSIPLLADAIAKAMPPSAAAPAVTGPTQPSPGLAAPAQPTTPATVAPPSAPNLPAAGVVSLPPNATAGDLTNLVKQLTDNFMASSAAQALSAEQRQSAALDYAFKSLQQSGVNTQAPQIIEITKDAVAQSSIPAWAVPAAIGAGALLLLTLVKRKRR